MQRIMKIAEFVEVTGLPKTTIWRRVRSGDFSAPAKLGSSDTPSIDWREGEIERWIYSRSAIDA